MARAKLAEVSASITSQEARRERLLGEGATTLRDNQRRALKARLVRLRLVPETTKTRLSRYRAEDRLRELEAQEKLPVVLKPVPACPLCHHEQAICAGTMVYMDGRREEISICRSCAASFNNAYSALVNKEVLPAGIDYKSPTDQQNNINNLRSLECSSHQMRIRYVTETRTDRINNKYTEAREIKCIICHQVKKINVNRKTKKAACQECEESIIKSFPTFFERGWSIAQIARWYGVSDNVMYRLKNRLVSRIEAAVREVNNG